MSDSFADLWNSTGASRPTEQPRKLGSLTTAPDPARNSQNDVFSMLASAGSSSANSRSNTPSAAGPIQSTRSLGFNALGPGMGAKPIQKSSSSGGDAFSNLLSGALASNSRNGANMTMAERAALAEKEGLEQMQRQQISAKQQASAWEGLDSLGASLSTFSAMSSSTLPLSQEDDWDFGLEPTKVLKPFTSAQSVPSVVDDWGLSDFTSQPSIAKSAATAEQTNSLFDLEDFESTPAIQYTLEPPSARSTTPGDFDFGDREDRLLDDKSDNEDDILGALSRPLDRQHRLTNGPVRATPSPQPLSSGQRSLTISPPPHILGQLVEMGFSVQQARVALAATDTGLDVQAALETLLANGAGAEPSARETQREDLRESRREAGWERYYESDENHREGAPPRRSQVPPSRATPPGRSREQGRDESSPSGDAQRHLQEQADKFLAQASEIGLSMFNRANALWKEGKEKVQRAYEERAAAAVTAKTSGADQSSRSGRPRWMQEVSERGFSDAERQTGDHDDFADEHEVLPPKPSAQARRKLEESRPHVHEEGSQPSVSERAKTGNLFSDDPPAVYVSPYRRKAPSRAQVQTPGESLPSPPKAPRAPSPVQLIHRKAVSASSAVLAASAKHKTAGTEMFKLGRYAEAETSYSSAIATLPESHLLLVPLYNNRALTRIKTGDYSGAIDDCTTVITLIGPSYHPTREAKVTKEDEGGGVDLTDGLIKALRRRAEAFEGKEKWDAARQDWEAINAAEWAGKSRTEAVRGAGRCRRMLAANVGTGASLPSRTASRPAPKPKPRPVQRAPTPPSVALNRVREANQAAEAEDQARHELKDVVDARLAAWKNGKEANIRALIASLDTVLWPELGWQKVGMHELVTPAQVKIRYTKAIAKLHPDKLNVRNTTLEQRMIANGVFGSLNEAWNAFKQ
ncbi:hypothetical protein AcV5_001446 [Taiwanofungus camphoratus]|nr:hypothetical protein AcV5_001446 [Antrodia cinnamomea]